MGMKVAVVGATGAVGTEMLRILEARAFPVDELVPLASARSAGRTITFDGREVGRDHACRSGKVGGFVQPIGCRPPA